LHVLLFTMLSLLLYVHQLLVMNLFNLHSVRARVPSLSS